MSDPASSVSPPSDPVVSPDIVSSPEAVAVPVVTEAPKETVQDLTQRLVQLLIDGVERKPESQAEALALIDYVYHRDILPIFGRMKHWALAQAQMQLDEFEKRAVEFVEKEASGCCLPKKQKPKSK